MANKKKVIDEPRPTTIQLLPEDVSLVERLREKLSLNGLNRTQVIRVVLTRVAEQEGVQVA